MKKSLLLLLSGVACLLNAERPNVLFIAIDDMKPLLNVFGYEYVQSPNIDKLADQGTAFLNAACQFPVCGASRASILTGLRPETTGVMDLKTKMRDVNPDVLTIPQHFKNNGYLTAGVGKIFDPRCVDGRQTGDAVSWTFPYMENPKSSVPEMPKSRQVALAYDLPDEAFPDGRILKGGLDRMREMSAMDQPFFLAVGFKKPHLPFIAPQRFWDLYDPGQIELAPFQKHAVGNSGYGYTTSGETRGYEGVPGEGDIPEETQRFMIHGYLACVSWVDHLVGELLEELDALGEKENTVIILWGDHGFHLGDHGQWGKHTPFEEAIRTPLILVDPRKGKGGILTQAPAEFTDVFPTLCELAGLEVPKQLQGVSLVECLDSAEVFPRPASTAIYKSRDALGYTVRTPRFRYIEWINKKTAKVVGQDLFDFKNDPLGKRNHATNPEYADVVDEMAGYLHADANGWKLLEQSIAAGL